MVIFGGRKTATYLSDLHILDLGNDPEHLKVFTVCCDFHLITVLYTKSLVSCGKGFMEYTAVKYKNMPPLPVGETSKYKLIFKENFRIS